MDILFILFPDDWQSSPKELPAGDSVSVVFPARAPMGVIHIRIGVRDVDPELMTLSLQAGVGALFELSAGATVDVLDENEDPDQPAGTASVVDEGHGVYHIEIIFNVQDQQWTLFVENSADTSASINVAAAGTDDPDSDTLRPWIDLPKGKIILKSHGFQAAPESAEIRFRNCGTATLKITQSPGQPLPGDIFELESVEPDVVEPGEEGSSSSECWTAKWDCSTTKSNVMTKTTVTDESKSSERNRKHLRSRGARVIRAFHAPQGNRSAARSSAIPSA